MPRYAADTAVTVERSRAEIEAVLVRYKASAFSSGWQPGRAMIGFILNGLHIRFLLPIPDRTEKRFWWKTVRGYPKKLSEQQAEKAWDQEVRQRWRALCLVVKAKLEAVECGISTLESEFLANIVLPNDQQLGEWVMEHAMTSIRNGSMPQLMLPGRREDGPIQDAEIVG